MAPPEELIHGDPVVLHLGAHGHLVHDELDAQLHEQLHENYTGAHGHAAMVPELKHEPMLIQKDVGDTGQPYSIQLSEH